MTNKGKVCRGHSCTQPATVLGFCMVHYQQKGQHPLKAIWKLIRSRSKEDNPARQYPKAWDNFEVFLKEVGQRPSPKHQLRHLDPDKPYSKGNIVWLPPLPGKRGRTSPEEASVYLRAWTLRRYYKISVEEYDAMLTAQDSVCACCKCAETRTVKGTGKIKTLAVDHCHATGKVRGLLCGRCNQGMGHFKDSPALLRAAITYLESYSALANQPPDMT
jgi:hypothetical protein